jgi:uncharacterized repeat protein (TIGR01451 family)
VPAVQSPAITMVKSSTPTSFDAAGAQITYSYDVTNTGNVTLDPVTVTDPMPGLSPISCPDISLAPTQFETCTATYTTTQADVDHGAVSNTGTATGTPPSGPDVTDSSQVTVPAVQSPAITVVKSSTPTSFDAAGAQITYSYEVTNTGNVTLDGVGVSDPMPGLSAIDCPTSTLGPGEGEACTATYTATQADVDRGGLTNTGTAFGTSPGGSSVTDGSSLTVPALQTPVISLVKSASVATVDAAGQEIDYSYDVSNSGNVTLDPVTVSDPMPGLSAVSCPQTSLAPGASETCSATYITTQADIDRGTITNTGTATGTPPSGVMVTDSSQVTVDAVDNPSIALDKTADVDDFAEPGTLITYSYDVENTGNVTLGSVVVSDPMVGLSPVVCPTTTLGPGATETCTATYTTTTADVDRGSITNTGTATGTSPSGKVVTDTSDVDIPAIDRPEITLVKSADTPHFTAPGTLITYTYEVLNSGNQTLDPVTVSDPMPGLSALSCPETSLAPGDMETCSATYTTTQADVDDGGVTNTATASGDPPQGAPPVTDTSTLTVPALQHPGIRLVKSADATDFSAPGVSIMYHFVVTNTGNVTLDPVRVVDTLVVCPETSLAPGASESCNASYVTTGTDVASGAIHNTATATGQPPHGLAEVSDASTVVVPLAPHAPNLPPTSPATSGSTSASLPVATLPAAPTSPITSVTVAVTG